MCKDPSIGKKPNTEEACCNAKTAADFEGKQCGKASNGCSAANAADIAFGVCGANWDCEKNQCACNEANVVLAPAAQHPPVVTDYLGAFGGDIAYECAPGKALIGIGSKHSDPA